MTIENLKETDYFSSIVLYEDNHLLVVDKPAGLVTMGANEGEESLFTLAKAYIKRKYQKPGAVYLGVVSRLDMPVSGVVVFARTSKAASRLTEQFKSQIPHKSYLALVEGYVPTNEKELIDFICEDKGNRRVWITSNKERVDTRFSPKEARLKYRLLDHFYHTSLLEVELYTGRKHQIRLQLSHQGFPIVGDGKYGAKPISQSGICLRAQKLTIEHPTLHQEITFSAPKPNWKQYF